jgi:spermidine/putrescine transport system permease protein
MSGKVTRVTRFNGVVTAITFGFLYLPLLVVAVYSFNSARFGAGWGEFTWRWYPQLLQNYPALQAAFNSLVVATASTVIATALGTALGIVLARGSNRLRRALSVLTYVPVVIPDILLAVGLILLFAAARATLGVGELGLATMVVAHTTLATPFVALIVQARMFGLDPQLEEAARDLGAGTRQYLLYVLIPLLRPALVAGALLAFTLSIDDFVLSFFSSGPGATTLPIFIYSSVRRGITPDINALSTLVTVVSIILVAISFKFQKEDK